MARWRVVAVLGGVVAITSAVGGDRPSIASRSPAASQPSLSPPVSSVSSAFSPSAPSAALAAREAELEALKARLRELDDTPLYEEAEAMGLTALVARSKLPDRQQRRLAVTIVREARRNGLDPLLVAAVIRCESAFDSYAVSPVGAMGLMQVMPDTGGWLMERRGGDLRRKNNLFDVELNVELGAAYLAELIQRFGTIERALVAYNAGPGAAKKILARAASRRKFMAGYPKTVVSEYRRLKARYEEERTRRLVTQALAGGSTPNSANRSLR